jgi:hypothetical protein
LRTKEVFFLVIADPNSTWERSHAKSSRRYSVGAASEWKRVEVEKPFSKAPSRSAANFYHYCALQQMKKVGILDLGSKWKKAPC